MSVGGALLSWTFLFVALGLEVYVHSRFGWPFPTGLELAFDAVVSALAILLSAVAVLSGRPGRGSPGREWGHGP